MKKNPPKILYVSFHKSTGGRCCTYDSMRSLRETHPAKSYDVVQYAPVKETTEGASLKMRATREETPTCPT
jgi:hypothetical protein